MKANMKNYNQMKFPYLATKQSFYRFALFIYFMSVIENLIIITHFTTEESLNGVLEIHDIQDYFTYTISVIILVLSLFNLVIWLKYQFPVVLKAEKIKAEIENEQNKEKMAKD
jgi:hypothetical protein